MSVQAQKRLAKEYRNIQNAPPPFIIARPNEVNILEWHYVITGPPNTCYEGGQYHGTLIFQRDYPFKPPAIRMITPNGRFKTNTRLCLLMLDFHPDTWNPAWSVSTILTGLLSFMTLEDATTGSIATTPDYRRKLAKQSRAWNSENAQFQAVFPDLVKENWEVQQLQQQQEDDAKKTQDEEVIKAEQIVDPEDRARASLLAEETKEGGKGLVWLGIGAGILSILWMLIK